MLASVAVIQRLNFGQSPMNNCKLKFSSLLFILLDKKSYSKKKSEYRNTVVLGLNRQGTEQSRTYTVAQDTQTVKYGNEVLCLSRRNDATFVPSYM